MEWMERAGRVVFMVLFGLLFSGVFVMLALETAIRRWRDDRRARQEPPADEVEAAYRARPKTRPTIAGRAVQASQAAR